MIRFYAQMYDATHGVLIDNTPKVYTIAEYTGYTDPDSEVGSDILFNHDGEVMTIPAMYSHINAGSGSDYSGNIGLKFASIAKSIHAQSTDWPVLRLLKTSSTNDNYLEWSISAPTGFNIKVDGSINRWNTCLQWSDTLDYQCIVFIKASNIADLTTADIHFSGGYLTHTPTVEGGTTIVGDSKGVFDCDLPRYTTPKTLYDQQVTANYTPTYNPFQCKTVIPNGVYNYYFACVLRSVRDDTSDWWQLSVVLAPYNPLGDMIVAAHGGGTPPGSTFRLTYDSAHNVYRQYFGPASGENLYITSPYIEQDVPVIVTDVKVKNWDTAYNILASALNFRFSLIAGVLYQYLLKSGGITPDEPDSDVDPDDIPPADTPPDPIDPDNPDPYYDPTSDPDSPEYDPTKDPSSPDYDPDVPHPPFNPPSTEGGGGDPDPQPPQDEIPAPETPPSYVTTNALFTLYNPAAADLTNLANFLWSPAWSIDTFKKIFANPLDCILGLMVMPYLAVDVATKNMNVGNIDTGVAMRYFTKQFYDFDCGDFTIVEFYKAYLDYAPYTKVSIFLPYIGDQQLNTDEVMGKTLNVKYRFDLATGDCVAFISVDGSVLYSFSGNCAARLPLSSNNYGGLLPSITGAIVAAGSMAAGVPALGAASALAVSSMKQDIKHTGSISGSAGLMGVQTPYLIITRPRQALPIGQNSFMGYPSFITESLGGLTGYTEVESCHLEHVPCTDEELREIENLLKGGVLL